MLFTSYEFIAFLIVLLFLYYIVPKKGQIYVLLLADLFFYYQSGASNLLYICFTGLSTWFAAIRIQDSLDRQSDYLQSHKEALSKEEKKAYKEKCKATRIHWVVFCLVLNLGILSFFKYAGHLQTLLCHLFSSDGRTLSFSSLLLPMGISFYTFQAISYLIDVYRGTVHAERHPLRFLSFISFFPLLIQGPISRFGDLAPTLLSEHSFDSSQLRSGFERILWGYFKKLVIADRLLIVVIKITGNIDIYQGAYAFWAMLLYTFQLYADFTGGIDIVIGIAETLGIRVAENFERPYFSKSLKEYWRRWHISMSTWFRDYVFYPCSSSRWMQKVTKFCKTHLGDSLGRKIPVYLVSFITWFCTGIWHGSTMNFLVWGLLNWFVLSASQELEPLYRKFHARFPVAGKRWYDAFQVLRTFALICVLNLFDCYVRVGDTLRAIFSVFTVHNWSVFTDGSLLSLGLSLSDYLVIALSLLLVLAVSLRQRSGNVREQIHRLPFGLNYAIWFSLLLIILLVGAYGVGYDASQFIYNHF